VSLTSRAATKLSSSEGDRNEVTSVALITAGLPSSGLMSLSNSTPSWPMDSWALSKFLITSEPGKRFRIESSDFHCSPSRSVSIEIANGVSAGT
jgi:hypothetical protein